MVLKENFNLDQRNFFIIYFYKKKTYNQIYSWILY